MKKFFFTLTLVMGIFSNAFSQATSLTVDCQNPGWLSSKIEYGDQISIQNLKVTGYLNSTDLLFIGTLMENKLEGRLDLSEVTIVKSSKGQQNEMPKNAFGLSNIRSLRCFLLPESLTSIHSLYANYKLLIDTLVIGGEGTRSLNQDVFYTCDDLGKAYTPQNVIIREGVRNLGEIETASLYRYLGTGMQTTKNIMLPSTLHSIGASMFSKNTSIQSINIPDSVESIGAFAFAGSLFIPKTFYLPKALKKLDFTILLDALPSDLFLGDSITHIDNSEYYDNNSGSSWYQSNTGYRPVLSTQQVNIHIKAKSVPSINVCSQSNNTQVFKNCTLFVPENLVEAYKKANFYKNALIVSEKEIEEIVIDSIYDKYVGDVFKLAASYQPVDATDTQIKFSSNNPTVLSINEGEYANCQKFGKATVTASTSYERLTKNIDINVYEHTTGVEISQRELIMDVGNTTQLSANVLPIGLSDGKKRWSSSNEKIATVDDKGIVTAIKSGECTITCITIDRGYTDYCIVKVIQPVNGISLNVNTLTLDNIGETYQLEAIIHPDDASNKEVIWTSSNPNVCVVVNGMVVSVGYGSSTVVATTKDGNFKDECQVTVINSTDIIDFSTIDNNSYSIYTIDGRKTTNIRKGINIIVDGNGHRKKIIGVR